MESAWLRTWRTSVLKEHQSLTHHWLYGSQNNPKEFLGLAGQAGTTSLIHTSWGMGEHLTPLKAAIRAQFTETLC